MNNLVAFDILFKFIEHHYVFHKRMGWDEGWLLLLLSLTHERVVVALRLISRLCLIKAILDLCILIDRGVACKLAVVVLEGDG